MDNWNKCDQNRRSKENKNTANIIRKGTNNLLICYFNNIQNIFAIIQINIYIMHQANLNIQRNSLYKNIFIYSIMICNNLNTTEYI